MRHGLFLLLAIPACTADPADVPGQPSSVRDQLADLTHLEVAVAQSGGAITTEQKVSGGWSARTVELGVTDGELIVSSDADDAVTIEGLRIAFAPLQLPAGTFGEQDARLDDVRVELTSPTRVAASWTSEDAVTLSTDLDITLSWTLTVNGSSTPLGSPDLPPVPVELVLTGDGGRVAADLRAHAPGELWSWAGLIKLSELELAVAAELADR